MNLMLKYKKEGEEETWGCNWLASAILFCRFTIGFCRFTKLIFKLTVVLTAILFWWFPTGDIDNGWFVIGDGGIWWLTGPLFITVTLNQTRPDHFTLNGGQLVLLNIWFGHQHQIISKLNIISPIFDLNIFLKNILLIQDAEEAFRDFKKNSFGYLN